MSAFASAALRAAFVALIALATAVGCSSSQVNAKALARLADATLTPGEGLGDLQLGTTTLRDFVQEYGIGVAGSMVGDEVGIEIQFEKGQLAVLFLAPQRCVSALGGDVRRVGALLQDSARFFTDFPPCADASLSSVTVALPEGEVEGFYRGSTPDGARLDATREAAHVMGGDDVRGLWLAGSSPDDSNLDLVADASGFVAFIGESPMGPNAGRLTVRKMSIFVPDAE